MERKVMKREVDYEFLKDFNWESFSLDTETTSLKMSELSIKGLSICDGKKVCYFNEVTVDEGLRILRDNNPNKGKNHLVICHNIVFDMMVLNKFESSLHNATWFDTMIAEHLIDENKEVGLKKLAKEYLGVDTVNYVDAVKDEDKFYEYAMNDSEWTYRIAVMQKVTLKKDGLVTLFRDIEMPFQRVIVMMNETGFRVDVNKAKEFYKTLVDKKKDLLIKMCDLLGEKYMLQYNLSDASYQVDTSINFDSPQQLANILFERLKLPIIEKTPSGKPSVGAKTISAYKDKNEFVKLLDEYKTCSKLFNSFVKPLPNFVEIDGRIRPQFLDHGTVTGRLSSRNPNLQQLPNSNDSSPVKIRELFIVPEGYSMITADYSGQELRVLAHISKDDTMVKAFKEGADFHQETADRFGVSRREAKIINFGIAYGKGAFGFAKDFETSEEEAQKMLDKYFDRFPKVKEAIDKCHKDLRENGYVTTLAGRRRHFFNNEQGYYPNRAYRQAFNFLIQGFSADMIRVAAVKCYNLAVKNPEWDLKIIGTVHDELIFQCKEEYKEVCGNYIKDAMQSSVNLVVPVSADIKYGLTYEEAK